MENRLFVITNATHYLNVKNYISKKPKAKNYIIVTLRPYDGYREFIDKIRKDPDVEFIGLIYTSQKSPILGYFTVIQNILKIKQLAKKYKFFDKILFTNYKSWNQQFIINQFKTKKLVLISDGAGIVLIAEKRLKGEPIALKSVPFKGHPFFVKRILGITPIPNLHFYSQIDMKVADSDTLEIFKFQGSENHAVDHKKLYFVGSPIVEIGYLSMEKHLQYLTSIKDHFKDYKITYFAHRRELDENLKQYEFFGKVVKNETPFEIMIQKEPEVPGVLISIISSVLINLAPVFPQIKFFYFPIKPEDIPSDSAFANNYDLIIKSFQGMTEPNMRAFSENDAVV